MQMKKELSLIVIFAMIATLLTGCSDITTITLNEDCSGSYSEVVTISKYLWDMSVGTSSDDNTVKAVYKTLFPAADVTIEDTVVNDVDSKEIHLNMNFKNESDFQNLLNASGMTSVKFNKNYYSRAALSIHPQDDAANALLPDNVQDMFGEDEQLMNALMAEMQNMNIKMTVTFPYTVLQTNGTIQEDGKTVIWQMQQLEDGQERYYAIFREQNSAKTPVFTGAKNGKFYNSGIALVINSENLLEQVTVNGQTTHSDYLYLTDEGTYQITALDMNNNKSMIKFQIDMTKPVIKGVKNAQTYKKARTIHFSDQGSGIKKATLNSKKISSGKKISKKGSYTLLVIDNAGNKKTVKFKIK